VSWPVEHLTGGADDLHERDALNDPRRRVSVLAVDRGAMVLGSTQVLRVVDRDAARRLDAEIVRRRTGGGAVFLEPTQHVWIDVIIPSDDPLWRDDVAHAFGWIGRSWAAALADVGVAGTTVNDTAPCHSVLGRLICFAGLGFGEVSTDHGKVVGLAQRRTRHGAWFQCTVLRRWDTAPYAEVLAPGLSVLAHDPTTELAGVRVHVVEAEPAALVDAFLRRLPA
jgi:lipoate-protein ligase A